MCVCVKMHKPPLAEIHVGTTRKTNQENNKGQGAHKKKRKQRKASCSVSRYAESLYGSDVYAWLLPMPCRRRFPRARGVDET